MNRQFHFKGFDPDLKLRSQADRVLNRLMDRAPYGATAVALLEREAQGFRCLLDIYSPQGPFITSAAGKTALDALNGVEQKMISKMDRWMNARMDSGTSRSPQGERRFFVAKGWGAA